MTQRSESNQKENQNVDRLLLFQPGQELHSIARYCRKFGIEIEVVTSFYIEKHWAENHLDSLVHIEHNLPLKATVDKITELAMKHEKTLIYLGSRTFSPYEITEEIKKNHISIIGKTNQSLLSFGGLQNFRNLAFENSIRTIPSFLTGAVDLHEIKRLQKKNEQFDFPLLIHAEFSNTHDEHCVTIHDAEQLTTLESEFNEVETFLIEPLFPKARVLEVPILIHPDGSIFTFTECEKSLQSNFCPTIYESPSPALKQHHQGESIRELLFQYAIKLASLAKIEGFSSVRFLINEKSQVFFHSISEGIFQHLQEIELLHGLDPVDLQIQTALQNKLIGSVNTAQPTGHVLTSFLYNTTPMPSKTPKEETTSKVSWAPGSPSRQRIDIFFQNQDFSSNHQSSNRLQPIARVITHDHVRHRSILRMDRLLTTLAIEPFDLNTNQIRSVLNLETFRAGQYDLSSTPGQTS